MPCWSGPRSRSRMIMSASSARRGSVIGPPDGPLSDPHLSDLNVVHGPKNAPAADCSSGEQKALLLGLVLAKARLIRPSPAPPRSSSSTRSRRISTSPEEMALFGEILDLEAQAWMTGTDRHTFASIASQCPNLGGELGYNQRLMRARNSALQNHRKIDVKKPHETDRKKKPTASDYGAEFDQGAEGPRCRAQAARHVYRRYR